MMSSFVTESYLERRHAVPIALALTMIKQGDWLLIAALRLTSTTTLTYNFLQLQMVDTVLQQATAVAGSDPCADVPPVLINPTLGVAYVAIFKSFNINIDPSTLSHMGTNVDVVSISEPGISLRDTTQPPLVIAEAGDYSFVLVNNTTNYDLRLAVTGQVIMTLA
jgi:hypothetical protein